ATDQDFIAASRSGDKAKLAVVAPVLRGIWDKTLEPAFASFLTNNHDHVMAVQAEGEARVAFAQSIGLAIFIFSVVLAGVLSLTITSYITRPIALLKNTITSVQSTVLDEVRAGAAAMAKGDLAAIREVDIPHIEWATRDELGVMCDLVNKVIDQGTDTAVSLRDAQTQFAEMISTVANRASMVASKGDDLKSSTGEAATASQTILLMIEGITTATRESAITTERLAEGSEQLAASSREAEQHLKRLAEQAENLAGGSSLQEQQVRKASDLTDEIVEAVGTTIKTVEAAKLQVEAARSAVDQLAQKQAKIGTIVQTIESIAEQTNLLALNAAIEAARAGEQGRGFAVVADEVRKLAEHAGSATKEISTIIDTVTADVKEASLAMDRTDRQVGEVVDHSAAAQRSLAQVREAAKETAEISKTNSVSIESMATAVQEVSSLVAQVASFAQESAAGTEELSAATEEMSVSAQDATASLRQQVTWFGETRNQAMELERHSDELTFLMSQFKLDDGTSTASQVRMFKAAHVRWCIRVREMIETGKLIPREDLTEPTHCALGKWYYGEGRERFGHLAAFKAIEQPHAQVHACAANALTAMEHKDLEAAKAAYDEMLTAKAAVLHNLDEMCQQGNQPLRRAA
ncbi:MAG TPA: methyl-accepting chemotaxis protein, partial [Fimbriimonadaceae bacterium]|nr:methyl-accepting chemotaxis protein [Fimbriimonadaceae bacterium]